MYLLRYEILRSENINKNDSMTVSNPMFYTNEYTAV